MHSALLSSPLLHEFAILPTICNAWNTTARYHQLVAGCLFGCEPPAEDRLSHYLCCPVLTVVAVRCKTVDNNALGPSPLLHILQLLAVQNRRTETALYINALCFTFLPRKHGTAACPVAIFATIVKVMRRRLGRRVCLSKTLVALSIKWVCASTSRCGTLQVLGI